MKVRMVTGISGGRGDGSAWPDPGGDLDVDDDEGAALCASGVAVPVPEERAEVPEEKLAATEEARAAPAPKPAKAAKPA